MKCFYPVVAVIWGFSWFAGALAGSAAPVEFLGWVSDSNQTYIYGKDGVNDMEIGPGGDLYLALSTRIFKRSPNGRFTLAAGTGKSSDGVQEGDALKVAIAPAAIAFSTSGELYFANMGQYGNAVFFAKINSRGEIVHLAGDGGYYLDAQYHSTVPPAGINVEDAPLPIYLYGGQGDLFGFVVDEKGGIYFPGYEGWIFYLTPEGVLEHFLKVGGGITLMDLKWGEDQSIFALVSEWGDQKLIQIFPDKTIQTWSENFHNYEDFGYIPTVGIADQWLNPLTLYRQDGNKVTLGSLDQAFYGTYGLSHAQYAYDAPNDILYIATMQDSRTRTAVNLLSSIAGIKASQESAVPLWSNY